MKYQLEITENNARVIAFACELLCRLYMGQLEEISDLFMERLSVDEFLELKEALEKLRPLATKLDSGHYGITSSKIPQDARTAFDIYQVIRHQLSWDKNPEGGFGVNFDKPFITDTNSEVATIRKID